MSHGERVCLFIQSSKRNSVNRTHLMWAQVVMSLEGHHANILQIEINVEFEQLVSLAGDGVVKVWDLRTNECIQTIQDLSHGDMKPSCFVVDVARNRIVSFGKRHQVPRLNFTTGLIDIVGL